MVIRWWTVVPAVVSRLAEKGPSAERLTPLSTSKPGAAVSFRWFVMPTVTVLSDSTVTLLSWKLGSPHSNPDGASGSVPSVTWHSALASMSSMTTKPGSGKWMVLWNVPAAPQSTVIAKSPLKPLGPPSTSLVTFRFPALSTLKLSLFVQPPSLRSDSVLTTTLYSPPGLLVVSKGYSWMLHFPSESRTTWRISIRGVPSGSRTW